jgi:hypothetical protein
MFLLLRLATLKFKIAKTYSIWRNDGRAGAMSYSYLLHYLFSIFRMMYVESPDLSRVDLLEWRGACMR